MTKFRHKKRDTVYELLGTAIVQTDVPLNDNDEVVIYLGAEGITLWARRKAEFYDGRFEQIKD